MDRALLCVLVFNARSRGLHRAGAQTDVSNRGRPSGARQFSAIREDAPVGLTLHRRQLCADRPKWFPHGPDGGAELGLLVG